MPSSTAANASRSAIYCLAIGVDCCPTLSPLSSRDIPANLSIAELPKTAAITLLHSRGCRAHCWNRFSRRIRSAVAVRGSRHPLNTLAVLWPRVPPSSLTRGILPRARVRRYLPMRKSSASVAA
eukprot:9503135-Pyramimonas_sp.AAC.1